MRKRRKGVSAKDGINLGREKAIIHLLRWLNKSSNWEPPYRMRPAYFSLTDRGLQVLQNVKKNSIIVSIPIERCVTRYYLQQTWLGKKLAHQFNTFSTQVLLSVWLALCQEEAWKPYLDSLPIEYSLPMLYSKTEIASLPTYLNRSVLKQREIVQNAFSEISHYFPQLKFDRFVWGFCTVNTRAVFLQKDPRDPAPGLGEKAEDSLALVPFLDLLNHSDGVSVEAGINLATKEKSVSRSPTSTTLPKQTEGFRGGTSQTAKSEHSTKSTSMLQILLRDTSESAYSKV